MPILFAAEHEQAVLEGTKTQTRRVWAKGCRVTVGNAYWAHVGSWIIDPFARLRVTALRRERLGAITQADAQAEGYSTPESFLGAFYRINRLRTPRAQTRALSAQVWVVTFELAQGDGS